MKKYKMYINGEWCDASDGKTTNVINPASEEVIAEVPLATKKDAEKAIQAAKDSFEEGTWRNMEPAERSRIMLGILKKFQERTKEFVAVEVQNSGATIRQGGGIIIPSAQNRFAWFARAANRIFEEPMPLYRAPAAAFPYIRREPVGVCAQIVPWNAPLVISAGYLGAPLAAGNSVIMKPSILTPCSLLELAEIIDESEVPKGVVNVVIGAGATIGDVLTSHPLVDKVSFTGSTETGKHVLSCAANTIKNTTMELGGKSANIFLDDVDLDMAVDAAIFACFVHAGQICYAGTRALVSASMYDAFVEKLVEKVNRIKVGDTMDMATDMGPVISAEQMERVMGYIAIGQKEGATLACGGSCPKGLEKGFYLEPAVFTNVGNSMRIAQDEIFGPVLCVIKYEGDEEAVRIANDSKYGLLGAVWSTNIERAIAVGERLRTGNVWINEFHMMSLDLPYGGVKQSGIGRERGLHGFLDEYTEIKSIQIDLGHSRAQRTWYALVVPR